jgi:hypothetical protein
MLLAENGDRFTGQTESTFDSMPRSLHRRPRWLGVPIGGMILLLVILLGRQTRRHEIVGSWKCNDVIVSFQSDGTWTAFKATDPTHYETGSGNWTINRNSVTLSFFNLEPPNEAGATWKADDRFTLDADGSRLNETEPETGSMIKQ